MKTLVKEKIYPQCQKTEKLLCDNCLSCLAVYSILEKEREKEGKNIEKYIVGRQNHRFKTSEQHDIKKFVHGV